MLAMRAKKVEFIVIFLEEMTRSGVYYFLFFIFVHQVLST